MSTSTPPLVVGLQPLAIVDHVCKVTEEQLRTVVSGEVGGSSRIEQAEVQEILAALGEFNTKAGGSAANTMRGLSVGFGVPVDMIGARGRDEWGAMFATSMKRASVGTSKLRIIPGPTGRCVILSCKQARTMRSCMNNAVRISASMLCDDDFAGAKMCLLSGYSLYGEGLLQEAVKRAHAAGCKIILDLGSFEIVKTFRETILEVVESGELYAVVCNADEAMELMRAGSPESAASEAVAMLTRHCRVAVVTLGEAGCMGMSRGEDGTISSPAVTGVKVEDTTGAGDLFVAGLCYGILQDYPLARCMTLGCLAGGAAVQCLGSELSADAWEWFHAKMHGDRAGAVVRESPGATQQELLACYQLIEKLGRGAVYYGSARLRRESVFWEMSVSLAMRVTKLLGCTTWSGGGPGMMEAASEGGKAAGGVVGGIRISREAGTTVRSASYLDDGSQVVCRYLSARKVALVDAGVRMTDEDHTAYIFLPGGLGTMDELFEIMTLMQLKKLDSKKPVPLILCNYDGFYSGLINLLTSFDCNGTLKALEVSDMVVCESNDEVIDFLTEFYKIQVEGGHKNAGHMKRASSLIAVTEAEAKKQRQEAS